MHQAGLHKPRHRDPTLGSLVSESLHDGVGDVQRYLHMKTIQVFNCGSLRAVPTASGRVSSNAPGWMGGRGVLVEC